MKHNEESKTLSAQTLTDLHADIAEKHTLLSSLQKSLPRQIDAKKAINTMLYRLSASKRITNIPTLRNLKRIALMLYRTLLLETSAQKVVLNWQSPSAFHALYDEAGNESGTITMTMNDYKRDYHHDAIPTSRHSGKNTLTDS